MNHYGNRQIVPNDWTAVRVTVDKGGVLFGMTDRERYENPTYLSGLVFKNTPPCITKPCLSSHNQIYFSNSVTVELVKY